jgi:ABC-type branched-subunit amino acid transport system substrate-binding protein
MVDRRTYLRMLGAGTLSMTAGCIGSFSGSSNSESMKIGVMVPLSGSLSPYGQMMQPAIELAVDEINKDGGIQDKQLEAHFEDTRTDPAETRKALQKLITETNVDLLLGPVSSSFVLANLTYINEQVDKPPLYFTGPGSSPRIPKRIKCNSMATTFHMSDVAGTPEKGVVEYAFDKLGSTFYYVGSDNDIGHDTFAAYKRILSGTKGEMINKTFYASGTRDFSTIIQNIQAANPDVVLSLVNGTATPRFLSQRLKFGMTDIPMLDTSNAFADSTIKRLDSMKALKNVYGGLIYLASANTDNNQQFVQKFKKRQKQSLAPTFAAQQSYDNIYYLKQGVEKAGSTETNDVAKSLEGATVSNLLGGSFIRAEDHLLGVPVFVVSMNNENDLKIISESPPKDTIVPLPQCK